ncbi:hypothetical protein TYRP_018417 [Tyrophagus putrescentiae]|nr:hypothetical protein TYRP_018417 [Tyrophagus putrescentiae]
MAALKFLLAVLGLVLLADLCLGATIRDGMGRQMDFDPNAEPALPDDGGAPVRIFEMIKNFLGMGDTRTTVMRSDGTIEEVDLPGGGANGGGFISRIGRRLMGFINTILSVLTGDGGSPRLDGYSARGGGTQGISNDIERELMKMARGA